MPYFVFTFGPLGMPRKLAQADSYREAKALLRSLREQARHEPPAGGGVAARRDGAPAAAEAAPIRMIFAANEIEAADLLTQPREPDPSVHGADD